jgi:hypothetical protein
VAVNHWPCAWEVRFLHRGLLTSLTISGIIELSTKKGDAMSVMTEEKTDVLKATDRCDRCQSQAYFWVNGVAGDLLFCRHHFFKYEEKLREYAFEVVDETYKINEKSESSA